MEEFILKIIEVAGVNIVPFLMMFVAFTRQQNNEKADKAARVAVEKARVEAERESRKEENEQQNNVLLMFKTANDTFSRIDSFLRTAYNEQHQDSMKTVAALEAQSVTLGNLETAMIEHTEKKPTIEDLMKAIEELGKKIDNVDHTVTEIKREFDNVKQQAVAVEKTVTQENEVVEVKPDATEVQTTNQLSVGGATKPESDSPVSKSK